MAAAWSVVYLDHLDQLFCLAVKSLPPCKRVGKRDLKKRKRKGLSQASQKEDETLRNAPSNELTFIFLAAKKMAPHATTSALNLTQSVVRKLQESIFN